MGPHFYEQLPVQFIRRWFSSRRISRVPFPCPHCGSEVPGERKSCPECGASDSDGWGDGSSDRAQGWEGAQGGDSDASDGWGEDPDFDYDSFVEREFGGRGSDPREFQARTTRPDPKRLVVWILILAFAGGLLLPWLF